MEKNQQIQPNEWPRPTKSKRNKNETELLPNNFTVQNPLGRLRM